MKKANAVQWLVSVIFITFVISCSDESNPVVEQVKYKWKETLMSPAGLFTDAQLEVGDDNYLYACASSTVTGKPGFFKYPGPNWNSSPWTFIAQSDIYPFSNSQSFQIYQGSIYYHVFDKLYKVEGDDTREILSSDVISGIKAYKDKLIIVGEGINISNDKFTIVSYDGTSFEPLSKEMTIGRIISANDKLYIQGYPGFVFDGQNVNTLDFFGNFFAVDADESIYFGDSFNLSFTMEKKLIDGQIDGVGNSIKEFGNPQEVEFYDGMLIVVGDVVNASSRAYYLGDQEWIQIPTTHSIYDVVVYGNKFLSISWDGKIFELVKK